MKRNLCLWTALTAGALCTGCVEQRYLITSDPPGAAVYRNGVLIGATPVDDRFIYYGKYHFTLVKDGKDTLQVDQEIPAPWYEYPPLDFVSEVLVPFNLHDTQVFHYQMLDAVPANPTEVLQQGQQLRDQGQALVPLNTPCAPGTAPCAPGTAPVAPGPAPTPLPGPPPGVAPPGAPVGGP